MPNHLRQALRRSIAALFASAALHLVFPTVDKALTTQASAAIAPLPVGPESQDRFAIQKWNTEDGLPQNMVTAILQTSAGYIWAATYNGIAQFDGLKMRVFDSSNTEGLPNSRITSLFEDDRGHIWIGHDTGEITKYVDGEFHPFIFRPIWTSGTIAGLSSDENGDVWALNLRGEAMRLDDGKVLKPPGEMFTEPTVLPQLAADQRSRLFVARNGAVAQIDAGSFRQVQFPDPGPYAYYSRVAAARKGGWWVSATDRVRRWADGVWKEDLGPVPWGDSFVVTMMESSSGCLLVGTLDRGVFLYEADRGWLALRRSDGLPSDWVRCLAEDRERNIWLGTGGGLVILRPRKVIMHNPPDLWQGRPVHAITLGANGTLWAATEGAGIYKRETDGLWAQLGTAAGLSNIFAWTVLQDSGGTVWAGTWGGGLFRWDGRRFIREFDLDERGEPVTALLESPPGTLWIGTAMGLLRKQGEQLTRLAPLGGPAAGDVRSLAVCSEGGIWIGTQGNGLGRLKDGKLQTFSTAEGLPRNFVLSLYDETDGTLWIGTLDRGIVRFRNARFTVISTDQGLPSNVIGHVADDQMGNLWFSSQKGIFRIRKKDLHDCADGNRSTLSPLIFGKAEGLSTLACSSGFTPSGFRSPDGRLWFPTAMGIAAINPQAVSRNDFPPHVWIEEVLVDAQKAFIKTVRRGVSPALRSLTLGPGRHQLDISFTGISFTSPERVLFRYRLEGIDQDFTEAGTRRRVTYPFLPPGSYRFQVKACNSDGLWNEIGDTMEINIRPHFWQTFLFKTVALIGGVMTVGAGVYVGMRRHNRFHLERLARERELERERARIAQDIHDDLGASLTRIGMLSQSAAGDLHEPERAAAELNDIYTTACELTRAMDEIVWAVNPRHDTLESLVNYLTRFAYDFLRAANIRCRIDAPVKLPEVSVHSEVRHNLFLAFKETLNNAVKHSGATEIRILLELLDSRMELVVADNGHGFTVGKAMGSGNEKRLVSGYGITGIQGRLEQIGGHIEIHSGSGEGTRVRFLVPIGGTRLPSASKPAASI